MLANVLVDTGAMVALLDSNDAWHERCTAVLPTLRLPLLTSTAVLTELFHLVGDQSREVTAAWRFVRAGVSILSLDETEMPSIEALMSKYRDRPMDFADATLVHLAQRESLFTIFTVDQADFQTYRIGGKRRFRIVPTPDS